MAVNRHYCMFENTFRALKECAEAEGMQDEAILSESEASYRQRLIELCEALAADYCEITG